MQYKLAERKHETQRFFLLLLLNSPRIHYFITKWCRRTQSYEFTRKRLFVHTPSFYLKICSYLEVWPQILESWTHFRAIDVYTPNTRLTSLKNNLLYITGCLDTMTLWMFLENGCANQSYHKARQMKMYHINIWQQLALQFLILQKLWKQRICLLPLCNASFSQ